MNELELAREDIDNIDGQMAALFVRRMEAASRVLEYKRANSMPIFDPEREGQVIEKGLSRLESDHFAPYYRAFLQAMMDISKAYQRDLLEGHKSI